MKKIFILAIIAVLGLSVTTCKCTRTRDVEEEVAEVVDSTAVDSAAVETPVDSTLVAE
jgi:hypothetical protein